MSGTGRWAANRSTRGKTEHVRLFQDDRALTFGQYLALLQDDGDFVSWYSGQLRESPFSAFFWEHPPLTDSAIQYDAEFVLVDAPVLDALRADSSAFRPHFTSDPVAGFRNLGGDAMLLAPSPTDTSANYAHLAAFLRTAPDSQIQALWHDVAVATAASLTDRPMWLSTSGLGVAWLHVRLDSSPKYYQHQPYKLWAPAGGRDEP